MGVEIDERDRGKFAVDGGADYGVHLNMTISIERLLQFRCAERFVQAGQVVPRLALIELTI